MAADKQEHHSSKRIHAVIDRIEDNDMAVILLGDDEKEQIDLPVAFLPEGASDGDHLLITITLDAESRAAGEDQIRSLQERLLKRSGQKSK